MFILRKHAQGAKVLTLRKNIEELMGQHLEHADKRLWYRTIFQAIFDLNHKSKSVRQGAEDFLSGKDGALADICSAINEFDPDGVESEGESSPAVIINPKAIMSLYHKIGPVELRKRFIAVLHSERWGFRSVESDEIKQSEVQEEESLNPLPEAA